MDKKILTLGCTFALLLVACKPPNPGSPQKSQNTSSTDSTGAAYDSIKEMMDDDMMNDHSMGDMMDDDMMGDMMMETASLKEGCAALSGKSTAEKKAILESIGHNMDKDALDLILGDTCSFAGSVEKVADIKDTNLKLMQENEELYFVPLTNQFFVTCRSLNSFAYVVERSNTDDPAAYFQENRPQFVVAASMAKGMMEMMETGEYEMKMDDGSDEPQANSNPPSNPSDPADSQSVYTAYVDGVIGNGEPSVLFFHASWCPSCRASDIRLKEFYGKENIPLSTYKIDFDTANDLKAQFGIVGQDTFVVIDGGGNVIQQKQFPSAVVLRDLLDG